MESQCSSHSLHAELGDNDIQRRTGGRTDRLTILQQYQNISGSDSSRSTHPLRGCTRRIGRARQCAARDDILRRLRHNWLIAHSDARIGRGWLRLSWRMRAHHCRTNVQQKTRHYVTSSAPSLTETLVGVSLMLHVPLVISIISAFIVIFLPSVVSIVMPPTPGRSLSVIVAASVLSTFISATAGVAGNSPCAQKHPVQMG